MARQGGHFERVVVIAECDNVGVGEAEVGGGGGEPAIVVIGPVEKVDANLQGRPLLVRGKIRIKSVHERL